MGGWRGWEKKKKKVVLCFLVMFSGLGLLVAVRLRGTRSGPRVPGSAPPRPRASLTGFYLSPVSVTIAQRPIRTKEGLDSWVLADHFRTGGWVDF